MNSRATARRKVGLSREVGGAARSSGYTVVTGRGLKQSYGRTTRAPAVRFITEGRRFKSAPATKHKPVRSGPWPYSSGLFYLCDSLLNHRKAIRSVFNELGEFRAQSQVVQNSPRDKSGTNRSAKVSTFFRRTTAGATLKNSRQLKKMIYTYRCDNCSGSQDHFIELHPTLSCTLGRRIPVRVGTSSIVRSTRI
jgi:hypothetical protein